jgi:hypothetical protein
MEKETKPVNNVPERAKSIEGVRHSIEDELLDRYSYVPSELRKKEEGGKK